MEEKEELKSFPIKVLEALRKNDHPTATTQIDPAKAQSFQQQITDYLSQESKAVAECEAWQLLRTKAATDYMALLTKLNNSSSDIIDEEITYYNQILKLLKSTIITKIKSLCSTGCSDIAINHSSYQQIRNSVQCESIVKTISQYNALSKSGDEALKLTNEIFSNITSKVYLYDNLKAKCIKINEEYISSSKDDEKAIAKLCEEMKVAYSLKEAATKSGDDCLNDPYEAMRNLVMKCNQVTLNYKSSIDDVTKLIKELISLHTSTEKEIKLLFKDMNSKIYNAFGSKIVPENIIDQYINTESDIITFESLLNGYDFSTNQVLKEPVKKFEETEKLFNTLIDSMMFIFEKNGIELTKLELYKENLQISKNGEIKSCYGVCTRSKFFYIYTKENDLIPTHKVDLLNCTLEKKASTIKVKDNPEGICKHCTQQLCFDIIGDSAKKWEDALAKIVIITS